MPSHKSGAPPKASSKGAGRAASGTTKRNDRHESSRSSSSRPPPPPPGAGSGIWVRDSPPPPSPGGYWERAMDSGDTRPPPHDPRQQRGAPPPGYPPTYPMPPGGAYQYTYGPAPAYPQGRAVPGGGYPAPHMVPPAYSQAPQYLHPKTTAQFGGYSPAPSTTYAKSSKSSAAPTGPELDVLDSVNPYECIEWVRHKYQRSPVLDRIKTSWIDEERKKGAENWEVTRCLMTVIKCRALSPETYSSGTMHLNELETIISNHKPKDGPVDIENEALQKEVKELNWDSLEKAKKERGLKGGHRLHRTTKLDWCESKGAEFSDALFDPERGEEEEANKFEF